jgi:hypothetical protein
MPKAAKPPAIEGKLFFISDSVVLLYAIAMHEALPSIGTGNLFWMRTRMKCRLSIISMSPGYRLVIMVLSARHLAPICASLSPFPTQKWAAVAAIRAAHRKHARGRGDVTAHKHAQPERYSTALTVFKCLAQGEGMRGTRRQNIARRKADITVGRPFNNQRE